MGSPPKTSERTDRIIQAAAQLFARQGYHGTSTREIARLADISENTLFRHFERKEDIFWTALDTSFSGLRVRKDLLAGIIAFEAPEIVLPQILSLLIETVTFKPQLLCLIAVALIELRWKAESVCHQHLSPIVSAFTSYLTRCVESQRIRNLDPHMITSAMAMTVMVHPELSRVFSGTPPPHSDSRDAIRAYTKFWLEVLIPQPALRPWDATPAVAKIESPSEAAE
ncbi:TetR/AcrR family transcriptional regulator [Acidobacteria bacterium AB60]|nr:TetR/AcrR family transcriptional regulator [Acidobacteria bacterium AB60]